MCVTVPKLSRWCSLLRGERAIHSSLPLQWGCSQHGLCLAPGLSAGIEKGLPASLLGAGQNCVG